MTTQSVIDELVELMVEYERLFNEQAPTMMLPSDDEAAARLLRRVIETRDPELIDRQFPPGAAV